MNTFIPIFINISIFIYSESSQQYFPFQSDIKIVVRLLLPYLPVRNLASITRDKFPFLSVSICVTIFPSLPPPSPQSGCPPLYSTLGSPIKSTASSFCLGSVCPPRATPVTPAPAPLPCPPTLIRLTQKIQLYTVRIDWRKRRKEG